MVVSRIMREGSYDHLREAIVRHAADGRSQRWIAERLGISRTTVITAAREFGVTFDRLKSYTLSCQERRVRETLLATMSPVPPPAAPRPKVTLLQAIHAYTAAWDRGW